MTKENELTRVFQVTIPSLEMPKEFHEWQKNFLNRLSQEIEPIREELGYKFDLPAPDKLVWRIDNREQVRERMREILPKYLLPDDDEFVNLLESIFYEGIESSLTTSSLNNLDFGGAAPLFFRAIALPPDIDELEPHRREFLTNNLYVEGRIPGLSEESCDQIFTRKGDYVIRGNLALFNADAFRALGSWLAEIKAKLEAGEVFGFKPGRPMGTGTGGQEADEKALEIYLIHMTLLVKAEKGKQRRRRTGRRRLLSIYDEVCLEYEERHGLPLDSMSQSTVKRLVRKGRGIYEISQANKSLF